jgi:biotin carboxyl carrier protein
MKVIVNGNEYKIVIMGNSVLVNGKQLPAIFNEKEITIDGKKFYLDYMEEGDPSLMIVNGMTYVVSKSSEPSDFMKQIKAPISGRIIEILVKSGDDIKKGQLMFVLDAMKMQNQINSPTTAKVSDLRVQIGQTVKTGDVLATLV